MKEFETKELYIREIKIEDAKEIFNKWYNDSAKKNNSELITLREVIKSAIQQSEMGYHTWIIEEKRTNELLGYISVECFSKLYKKCNISFDISDIKENKTYLESSLQEIFDYLSFEEDFDTIETELFDNNLQGKEVKCEILEKLGMKEEKDTGFTINPEEHKKLTIYSIHNKNLRPMEI